MLTTLYNYQETLAASARANWRIQDIIGGDKRLDFTKAFMPDSLARVNSLEFLNSEEKILLNQIRDEVRKMRRRPARDPLDEEVADGAASPLDRMIGTETRERYEQALGRLSREQQEAVVLRIEFGFDYEAMAEALQRPTANAARKLVGRALVQLARYMREK